MGKISIEIQTVASSLCDGKHEQNHRNTVISHTFIYSHSHVFCALFRKRVEIPYTCMICVQILTLTYLRCVTWNNLFNVSMSQDLHQHSEHNSINICLALVLLGLDELMPIRMCDLVPGTNLSSYPADLMGLTFSNHLHGYTIRPHLSLMPHLLALCVTVIQLLSWVPLRLGTLQRLMLQRKPCSLMLTTWFLVSKVMFSANYEESV